MRIYSMIAWATAASAMSVPETWKTPSAPLAAVGLRAVAEPEITPVPVASVAVALAATGVAVAPATVAIVVGKTPELTAPLAPVVTLNTPD